MPKFPYHRTSDGSYYPTIPVIVPRPVRNIMIETLVDSGATISIFRPEVADELNLKIESGQETYLGGVGGRIRGFVHTLSLIVAGRKIKAPVVFSREYMVSFNLLGRQDIFEHFLIIFDETRKQTVFRIE